jgi:SAM-dependent methyltransferase
VLGAARCDDVTFNDRWTVRVPADSADVVAVLRRAADYLESLGPVVVERIVLDREGDDLVLTACFDHDQLPTDLEYLDRRYAESFDAEEEVRDDFDFMVDLANEVDARTIVDLGCGTGRLATYLAADGRRVIGIDPAPAMIDVARRRQDGERIEWIVGDASAIATTDADLVVMTGNITGYIVDDGDWLAVLQHIRDALRAGGRIAFSSRNAEDRAWERWGEGYTLDNGVVHVAAPRRNSGIHTDPQDSFLVFGDEVLVADSAYRVRTLEELQESLASSGFDIEHLYGGWDRRPLAEAGEDLVFVATRR